MKPGQTYTADDGSTIELQLLIQEAPVSPADRPFVMRPPDRLRDVRLFMTAPDGQCAALHLHSKPENDFETMMTMYGNVEPPLHVNGGIITDPREWSGPLRGEW